MKIGTFVGQEELPISKKVANVIKTEVVKAAKELFGDFDGGFEVKVTNTKCCSGTHLFISLKFKDEKTYRNSNGTKFKPFMLTASLFHQKGYDEAKTGPFYTWEKGFKPEYDVTSYQLTINLIGEYREYRRHNTIYGGIGHTAFTYGTELEDLEVRKGIKSFADFIKHSTISKF